MGLCILNLVDTARGEIASEDTYIHIYKNISMYMKI